MKKINTIPISLSQLVLSVDPILQHNSCCTSTIFNLFHHKLMTKIL